MADNHDQFIAFNNVIMVTASQKKQLQGNRDALREKIRKY